MLQKLPQSSGSALQLPSTLLQPGKPSLTRTVINRYHSIPKRLVGNGTKSRCWGKQGNGATLARYWSSPFLPGCLGAGARSASCRSAFPFPSSVLGP